MNESTTTARPLSVCPAWCLGGHDQTTAFHHMGEASRLVPQQQPLPPPHEQEVRVLPSVFVDEHRRQQPACVELRVGEGTWFALAELSPAEARRVARWLLDAAEVAGPMTNEEVVDELRATMDRFRRIEEKVAARIEARGA